MIDKVNSIHGESAAMVTSIRQKDAELDSFQMALQKATETENIEELQAACDAFEAYFINTLFTEMRKTVTSISGEEKSPAESTFQDMLDSQYAEISTKAGGIGLSSFMMKEMTSRYEGNNLDIDDIF